MATLPAHLEGPSEVDLNSNARLVALYAERYAWLRLNPAFETEALLGGLSPDEFDELVDKHRAVT